MAGLEAAAGVLVSAYAWMVFKVYLDTFLRGRKRLWTRSGCLVFFLWQCLIHLEGHFLPLELAFMGTMAAAVAMASVSYEGGWGRCCMFAMMFAAIWVLVKSAVEWGAGILLGQAGASSFIQAVCVQSMMALMVAAIRAGADGEEGWAQGGGRWFFAILPVAGAVLYFTLHKMAAGAGGHGGCVGSPWLAAAAGALLAVDLSLYPVYMLVMGALHDRKSLSLYKKHIELFGQERFLEEAAASEILELKHDIKQELVVLRHLLKEGRKEEALDSIGALIGSVEEKGRLKSNTGNLAVDALVNHAWLMAAEKNIDFYAKLDGLSGIGIPNSDLCILLGNALDNALEASEYVPENERAIWVEISYVKKCLLITLRNRYAGGPVFKGGRPCSRKEGKGHGIGLLSMEKAAAKLDGTLAIEEHDGIFSLEIWVPCN